MKCGSRGWRPVGWLFVVRRAEEPDLKLSSTTCVISRRSARWRPFSGILTFVDVKMPLRIRWNEVGPKASELGSRNH